MDSVEMTSNLATSVLGALQTEGRNVTSTDIDIMSTLEMCRLINEEDATIASSVNKCLPDIASTIDLIAERVRQGGRVIYIGAGTSGRLGVLDASEIPPTFSAPYSQFIALMAGGETAIRKAVEGAEDSVTLPLSDLSSFSPSLGKLDTLIGIAASGRTPYVLAGLSYARENLNMFTVGITCVEPSAMRGKCDCLIECVVGPEIITGSTRMKSGTATKLILNMISTGVMIRIGKTYGNMMVDLKTSNVKLVDRALRIYRTLLPDSALSDTEIDDLINACNGSLKRALVVGKLGCSVPDAIARLDSVGGVLKRAWDEDLESQTQPQPHGNADQHLQDHPVVLCIDAGGSKCSAVIAGKDGILATAIAGPCNFLSLGHETAMSVISDVTARAISGLAAAYSVGQASAFQGFAAAWVGGAGLDRAADLSSIKRRLADLLSLSEENLFISNDAALLSSAIIVSDMQDIQQSPTTTGIVLITGTGTIAYSYKVMPQSPLPSPLDRSAGWGYLLGDEGSGYYIGREAIRAALRSRDAGSPPSAFHEAIAKYFDCRLVGDIISAVYNPSTRNEMDPKLRIAGLCPLVFAHAFSTSPASVNKEALGIVQSAAISAAETVAVHLQNESQLIASNSTLVMGGTLGQIALFKTLILDALHKKGHLFKRIVAVPDAAAFAVRWLASEYL